MPIRLEILDYVSLKELRHLTYPAVWTAVTSRFASTVRGVAARTTDVTAGLALAVPGPSGQFELLSVYVLPMLRRMGFGSSMLGTIEEEFRGLGFRRGVHFLRVGEHNQDAARFFVKNGWTRPAVNKLVCHTTVPLAFETPWLVEARLPVRYRIVGWRSLGADQRATIRDFDEPGVNDDVNPFIYEEDSDPHTSLALVDAEGGTVRGWAITHRLDSSTLRWTCSFIHPSLQATALMRPLWLEVARRQRAFPELVNLMFTVPVTEPRMARFALRRMRPWLSELAYACITMKRVA
ncbi:GNAT family N-acetyltransferase [Mesorhizobium huakuii]|uniref:GNAT family N-acetyltransferase n=1 Tax=Mesorhizobium huakuii TaxID=28104 RepID=A0A7G6T4S9_9HYPH|nr:GNAT family N-acetyltransferase [Mesorhizobium huakuii]QND61761.1 GNAT family N-acetyltransferase [Mesorhizobium huakuii]QND69294.1 GNAT family N-acetyltransferase [Mesorhizobium loti]